MIDPVSASEPAPASPANHVVAAPLDFRTLFESSPAACLVLLPDDPFFTIVAVTDAYEKLTLTHRDQIVGRGIFEVFPASGQDESEQKVRASFQRVIAQRSPNKLDILRYDIPRPDGSLEERYWIPAHYPVLAKSGEVAYIINHSEDVTAFVRLKQAGAAQSDLAEQFRSDSQRSEAALRASEKRFRQLAEVSAIGLVIADLKGRLTYLNPAMQRLLDCSQEEVEAGNVHWDVLTPPGLTASDRNAVEELMAAGTCQPYEKILVAGEGREVPILVGASILESTGGEKEVVAFVVDLTARKQAEEASHKAAEAIEQQWRLFDTVLASTPDFAYVFDLNGRFTHVNQALLALWGKSLDEAVGKNFFELDYPPELAAKLQAQIQHVIETRERLRDETAYTAPNGSAGYYEYIFVPVFAGNGTVEAVAGTTRDITRRKAAEADRERLVTELAQNNRELLRINRDLTRANRELEEFAYVSSHDLQEPLRMINIYTQLLLKKHVPADKTEARQFAEFIRTGVHRMEELIHDLLSYSQTIHSDVLPVETADLAAALRRALSALNPQIGESGASITHSDLPTLTGDEVQLAHVFQNLLSNSLKYRKESEAPVIHISATPADREWIIAVEDNGIGFEPQYARTIFGLFKRLHKEAYPGTGLGLAICQRIVERYGGRMWAESELGKGAKFNFALPKPAGK
jgi:PAS domain S-box-containing protein